jgi:uncharacterized protein Yka (UPF0111/DUF47 family)
VDKNEEDRYTELIQAARDAAFEAAEAMDRRDVVRWNELQDRAAELRKQADALKRRRTRKRSKETR